MMRGLGTLINIIFVLIGSAAGSLLGERLNEKVRNTLMSVIGLVTSIVGVSYGIKTENILIPLGSLLLGAMIGEFFRIEDRLEKFALSVEKRVKVKQSTFVEGFVTASLVFCVGPMAIIGSLNDGMRGDINLLALKSVLDGFAGMAFASTLGWGVMLSVIPIFIYQGSMTLLGAVFGGFFTDSMIREMTAVGGILIFGIGLKLLNIKKMRLGNMLPGLLIVPWVVYALEFFKIKF